MKTSKNMTLEETIVHSCAHCYIPLVNFRPTIGKSSLRFSSLRDKFQLAHFGLASAPAYKL